MEMLIAFSVMQLLSFPSIFILKWMYVNRWPIRSPKRKKKKLMKLKCRSNDISLLLTSSIHILRMKCDFTRFICYRVAVMLPLYSNMLHGRAVVMYLFVLSCDSIQSKIIWVGVRLMHIYNKYQVYISVLTTNKLVSMQIVFVGCVCCFCFFQKFVGFMFFFSLVVLAIQISISTLDHRNGCASKTTLHLSAGAVHTKSDVNFRLSYHEQKLPLLIYWHICNTCAIFSIFFSRHLVNSVLYWLPVDVYSL